MYQYNNVYDFQLYNEERRQQLTEDYRRGKAAQDAVVRYVKRAWNKLTHPRDTGRPDLHVDTGTPQVSF